MSLAHTGLTYGRGPTQLALTHVPMEYGLIGKVLTSMPKLGIVMHKLHEVGTSKGLAGATWSEWYY